MKPWKIALVASLLALVGTAVWAVRIGPLSFVTGYFLSPLPVPNGTITLVEPEDSIRYFLYVPPGFDAANAEATPLVVHLHGAMPFPWSVAKRMVNADLAALAVSMEALTAAGDQPAPVIIAPYDGFGFSMWSDSSSGHVTVESDIVTKIIPAVAGQLSLTASRENTWIQGFSMGGFGALKIGLKHPELFSRVTSWDGAVHDWQSLNSTRPQIVENMFSSESDFDRHSPWVSATALSQDVRPEIRLFSGTMDAPSRYTAKFRAHLETLSIPHQFTETDCSHDIFCFMSDERVASVYARDP